MPKFVIERELPGAGALTADELHTISCKSNDVLTGMAPRAQWLHSYVTGDKIYCVYIAEDEAAVREHADRGGFPANAINQVSTTIDPTTGKVVPVIRSLTYRTLIKAAFKTEYVSTLYTPAGHRVIEENFSLFWGLSIQMYESTLIADQTPLDAFLNGDSDALSEAQKRGMEVFTGKGQCVNCHGGPDLTNAGYMLFREAQEGGLISRMLMGDGNVAAYDEGFYNICVVPAVNDVSLGGTDPWGYPLSFTRQYLADSFVDKFKVNPCTFEVVPEPCEQFVPDPDDRDAVDGSFKTPGLRNIELTAPYFHNGGYVTLEQVVEFYNRGGNRRGSDAENTSGLGRNKSNLDPDIEPLGLSDQEQADLVAFLKALTDERVRFERAPFDHPSLRVPNGHVGDEYTVEQAVVNGLLTSRATDQFLELQAVGAKGSDTPILTFSPLK